MQYTLRNIPAEIDAALRERARREGKSLNRVALDALTEALGLGEEQPRRRDIRQFLGTWAEDDPELQRALEDPRRIDPELWEECDG